MLFHQVEERIYGFAFLISWQGQAPGGAITALIHSGGSVCVRCHRPVPKCNILNVRQITHYVKGKI
jgi:hypothetical protein